MNEYKRLITIKGNPLTLAGGKLKIADQAPDAILLDNDLNPVNLSFYNGKVRIISSVPSLDTPVCDLETKRFNKEAGNLGDDVRILTISMDLPFAQKRWCGAADVKNIITLSDHRLASFGTSYGVLIKELRLLARCIFIVNRENAIRYIQLVKEITQEPDYSAVLAELKKITGGVK